MIGHKAHSLASPIGGSAAFSHGTKNYPGFITISVGKQTSYTDEYITKSAKGLDVLLNIQNGILEFSYPQTHPYIGVGDTVTFTHGSVILNRKISTTKWEVLQSVGGKLVFAQNVTKETLISINKTFSGLKAAVDGAHALVGAYDLTKLNTILRIACYEMNDSVSSSIDPGPLWITDSNYYIKIFAPIDLKSECNSRQKHSGIPGGYKLSVVDGINGITPIANMQIDGLWIDGNSGNTNGLIVGLKNGIKIINNLLTNAQYAIFDNIAAPSSVIIKGNIIYGMKKGAIFTSVTGYIYNNTIIGKGITEQGIINGSYASIITNNLVQNCTIADIVVGSGQLFNCITKDNSSSGGTDCHPNITIQFKDESNNDYRLDPKASDEAVRMGKDLSNDLIYSFITDVSDNSIDNTWPIGAYHYVRELKVAIGSILDLKTGTPSASITNGVMNFDTSQTNQYLCSGCLVTMSDASQYILYEKYTDTSWLVTKNDSTGQGKIPENKALTSITTITTIFNNLDQTVNNSGMGDPLIYSLINTSSFITSDLKPTIYCSYGTETNPIAFNVVLEFDFTRFLTITTPYDIFKECNVRRRHSGVLDFTLWNLTTTIDGLTISKDNVVIDGLQITSSEANGIIITVGGNNQIIKNNIIYSCGKNGINCNNIESEKIVIVNNLIYKCKEYGINISHISSRTVNGYHFIYNNTLIKNKRGINIEIHPEEQFTNKAILKNNLEQGSTEKGYSATIYDPDFITVDSCWSEDESLYKFQGSYNQVNKKIIFRNNFPNNYHISFATSLDMTDAVILSTDSDYSVYDDFEGNYRTVSNWCIGCVYFVPSLDNIANFSLGISTDNFISVGLTASIKNSIITFSNHDIDHRIGVGDKIILASGGTTTTTTTSTTGTPIIPGYYLAEKGNNYTWIIRDRYGSLLNNSYDCDNVSVASIARVTHNLHDAFVGLNIAHEFGSVDLITNKANLFIWCYNDGGFDAGNVTINGWSCSQDYKMVISTPWNTITQCNTKQRHSGIYSTSAFGIESSAGGIIINNSYVNVEGLIIKSVGIGILIQTGCVLNLIDGNLIIGSAASGDYGIKQIAGSTDIKIFNNIIYNTDTGIDIVNGGASNNTVPNALTCGISRNVSSADASLTNNLVQVDVSLDPLPVGYSCAGDYGAFENCISNDITGASGYKNIDINFLDPDNNNYHLARHDFAALNKGLVRPIYSYGFDIMTNYDIDMDYLSMDSDDLIEWSMGADSVPNVSPLIFNFSSSKTTDDLKSGLDPTITIINGIAEFSIDQDGNIGIGDTVDYHATAHHKCYLYKKYSYKQWEVRTVYGAIPNDISNVALNSIKHSYEELNAAISDLRTLFKNGYGGLFNSLIDARCQINIPMYKSNLAHTVKVDISNIAYNYYASNKNYYLRIYPPSDNINECNSSQRHKGYITDAEVFNEVRIEPASGDCIKIGVPYIIIDGLIILTQEPGTGVIFDTYSIESKVTSCLIMGGSNGIDASSATESVIINNIIANKSDTGIKCSGSDFVCNNTVVNCGKYGIYNETNDILFNNIVQNNSPSGYISDYYNASIFLRYCISQDASAGIHNECISNVTMLFENKDNNIYHLNINDIYAMSNAMPFITNNHNFPSYINISSNYAFSIDACGLTRNARWDRGALEYQPYKVYYGIGLDQDIKIAHDDTLHYSINKTSGIRIKEDISIITFADSDGNYTDQIHPQMGVGNEIISSNFVNGCLIKQKISLHEWMVTDYYGKAIDNISGEVKHIIKPFNSIYSLLSDISNSVWSKLPTGKNLASSELQLNVVAYNDGIDRGPIELNSVTTTPDCTIRIYAPYDIINEVNSRQRHNGHVENGYTIRANNYFALKFNSINNIIIEGLIISNDSGDGIQLFGCNNHTIIGNIIYNCGISNSNSGHGIYSNASIVPFLYCKDYIINNLIYNCSGDGVRTGTTDPYIDRIKGNIFNNTIYHCLRGIYITRVYVQGGENTIPFDIKNNIIQKSIFQNFVIAYALLDNNINYLNNVVDDYYGFPSYYTERYTYYTNYRNTIIKFVNVEDGSFDLNRGVDFSAYDTAIDLSAISEYAFDTDITLSKREPALWDRGAFEYFDAYGTGSLMVNPVIINVNSFSTNVPPTFVIHLRKHILSSLPLQYQFPSIEGTGGINEFLANNAYVQGYNLEINVEANQQFSGVFKLLDRASRTVVIKTYLPELENGPASLIYTTSLIDEGSKQYTITYEDLKIYSDESALADYLAPSSVTDIIRFKYSNCIVQLNSDAVFDIPKGVVYAFNTFFIYRNAHSSSNLYLSKNNLTSNLIANSAILSRFNSNLTFSPCLVTTQDEIHNTLTYNYDTSSHLYINNTKTYKSLVDTDPVLSDVVLVDQLFDIETIMSKTFKPEKISPIVDAGDNIFITEANDIVGNIRVFNYNIIDIGPYELEVYDFFFNPNNIEAIYQDKLNSDYSNKQYVSSSNNIILKDLYSQFDADVSKRDEYARESKILITLKIVDADYKIMSDKKDIFVQDFEAYYDEPTRTLVITKKPDCFGNIFSNVFSDGRYVFRFSELTHTLSVYITDTFNKGASGDRNPIKNVKFGGRSLITN